jgi:Crp-like helix-turn-helix domain
VCGPSALATEQPSDDLIDRVHLLELRERECADVRALARCARWILSTLDRVDADRFSITHEFLAMLLGTRRQSISVVVEQFAERGILRVERGRLRRGIVRPSNLRRAIATRSSSGTASGLGTLAETEYGHANRDITVRGDPLLRVGGRKSPGLGRRRLLYRTFFPATLLDSARPAPGRPNREGSN